MLQQIENRLATQFDVKTIMDFAVLDKMPPVRDLSVYVVPLKELVTNTEMTGITLSKVVYQVGIVTALRSAADPRGGVHQRRLEDERKKIRDLLAGWVPDTGYEPIQRTPGQLLNFKNSTVYWLDTFETTNTERAVHNA